MANEELTPEEQNLFKFFVKAFDQVVAPMVDGLVDEMATKKDLKRIESVLQTQLDRVERKLDHFTAKSVEHDQRIKKLEHSSVTA